MFNSHQTTLLGRSKTRLSNLSHLVPDTSPKARRNARKALRRNFDSAWTSTNSLRSPRAAAWIGGGAAILSALGLGYSLYSRKKKNRDLDQEW